MTKSHVTFRLLAGAACLAALTACTNVNLPVMGTLDTGAEPRTPTAARPEPDARGVLSYPNYQVAVARQGDTINSIGTRLGLSGAELARANGLPADATLRAGELILLPTRVAAAPAGTVGTGGLASGGGIDVTTIANDALDRAGSGAITPAATTAAAPEPRRHTVARGETAYSIARIYDVPTASLAQWNGLDGNLTVREGQVLLIPVATGPAAAAPEQVSTSMPGQGTVVAEPPSAATAQPAETPPPAAEAKTAAAAPQQPIQSKQTAASDTSRLLQPVSGRIIRGYEAKKNEGLDFGASAGSAVRAADGGTVAAITRDTDQVPILVLRHPNNLLTVYANVENISVAKGESVSRGQNIATVRAGDPAFLHFEVRNGFDSVDPMPYLTQ
jgi:murein DD-endopeptidase MepM/ murein hydrolase activator NlpD